MLSDFEEEKRNLTRSMHEEFEKKEATFKKTIEELHQSMAQLKLDNTSFQEENKRRHITELRLMEDRWKLEKDEWQTHLMNKYQKEFLEKEASDAGTKLVN